MSLEDIIIEFDVCVLRGAQSTKVNCFCGVIDSSILTFVWTCCEGACEQGPHCYVWQFVSVGLY